MRIFTEATVRNVVRIQLVTLSLILLVTPQLHGQNAAPASAKASRTVVVVLGSGVPVPDPDRFGPAVVIVVDSSAYLFDAGVGVVRRWAAALKMGVAPIDPSALRKAFITHLHTDHTLGLPELIFTSWTIDRRGRPLDLYGPRGLDAMTTHILAAYSEDIDIRTGKGGDNDGAARPVVRVHEIDAGIAYKDSLVEITAFPVHHGTWPVAFGYRVRTPDKVIVLSGDTSPVDVVAEECNGCDILLHEGGAVTDAESDSYYRNFHTTTEQLARIATKAKPKLLVLYHQRPLTATTEKSYRLLRSLYSGALVVARDLDAFR
jgi:ribonuclease BN (tRNA processing enzyme)